MAHLPAYPALQGPRHSRPAHLRKYSEPLAELIDEVTNEEDYWYEEPGNDDKQPVFTLAMAGPSNDRFLVLLSVKSNEQAEDPRNVKLAEQVIQKIEEKFPELVDWMDWQFAPPSRGLAIHR